MEIHSTNSTIKWLMNTWLHSNYTNSEELAWCKELLQDL